MAIGFKDRNIWTLILIVIVGILIGAYLSTLFTLIPGSSNVVKNLFTYNISFGFGDFVNNKPLLIDLAAIKFQLGFQMKFNLLSLVGVALSLYLFRWYR
ncbi:MAG TPA: DUF4321 domain-containing protein [Chitinivibrionales bacterium]|nr:DUF4321 domain-containing protein [Chitinivibrionales bacterium]